MNSVNEAAEIRAKTIVTPTRLLGPGMVVVRGGKIEAVEEYPEGEGPVRQPEGILIPGMIDVHINGAFGVDFANCDSRQLAAVSTRLSRHGCTSFLPTLISDQPARLKSQLERLSEGLQQSFSGAEPLGIHLEGPFLNPARAGAHPATSLTLPSLDLATEFVQASGDRIRLLTLAPELPGTEEFLAGCPRNWIVSAGHSEASLEEMSRAITWGIRGATHVFNAMAPLGHRTPGLLAAILNSEQIFAEIIADGLHVHPAVVQLLVHCKGSRRVMAVTDATSAAGMPDGDYPLGGTRIRSRNGTCRNSEGILAGSSLLCDRGLRQLWSWLGGPGSDLPLPEVVWMTSSAPAEFLGLAAKGRIEPGCDADLVLVDENLEVCATWVDGRLVFDARSR